MIDASRGLIFVHIARTGGSSIETALVGRDWWHEDPRTKHVSASQARMVYGEDIWNSYKKFTVVRNPWDRIVSLWATGRWGQLAGPRGMNASCAFRQFISRLAPHPNERYGSLHYHSIIDQDMDYILRFESLQEDFDAMLDDLGADPVSLPHVGASKHSHYSAYYDDESARLVSSLWELDIRKFQYSF